MSPALTGGFLSAASPGKSKQFSIVVLLIMVFPHPYQDLIFFCTFYLGHSGEYRVGSHCVFNLHFSDA